MMTDEITKAAIRNIEAPLMDKVMLVGPSKPGKTFEKLKPLIQEARAQVDLSSAEA
ncbi:hypothetical protein [Paenibacillus taichungensis]